jgi:MFS family permease
MILLFAVVLIDMIGFGIIIPILPFLSPTLGADKLDIALIIATYALCAGLCGPFWGRLSDRIGRKPVIMLCLLGGAAGYAFLGLASALWMIYAARAFAGLMAGNLGVASAMMADITAVRDRARGMGLIGAAFGLGLVLGPVLGGLLSSDSGGFLLPCLFAGGMSLLALLAAALFLPESLSREGRREQRRARREAPAESLWALLRRTGSRLLMLQYVLHTSSVSAFTYLFPLWAGDRLAWGAREVGVVFGVQGAIMALTQGLLMGPLVRWFGEIRLLRLCVGVFLCGLVLAVFASGQRGMLAAVFIGLTGATLCVPLLNSLTSQRSEALVRGRMMGTASAATAWGRVAGPLLAGALLVTLDYRAAWAFFALLVSAYFYWALFQAGAAQENAGRQTTDKETENADHAV